MSVWLGRCFFMMPRTYSFSDFALNQFLRRLLRKPVAFARIVGSEDYPKIRGYAAFSRMNGGTWMDVEVKGLPPYRPARDNKPPIGPFGFHIHEGEACKPKGDHNPFEKAKGHYNPDNQPHGNHAGDLPVLIADGGVAKMGFYTDRFKPAQIIGKTIVIHLHPDDYRSQPAGDSGKRIACGEIERN